MPRDEVVPTGAKGNFRIVPRVFPTEGRLSKGERVWWKGYLGNALTEPDNGVDL